MAENMVGMKRLSEVMQHAKKPATYAREFMRGAERGSFTGVVMLADRIAIKPNKKGGRTRYIQDFAIIETREFLDWNSKYLLSEGGIRGLPKYEEIQTDSFDLEAAQKATLEYLKKRRKRSQQTAESVRKKKQATNTLSEK